jgi:hypothetical protein
MCHRTQSEVYSLSRPPQCVDFRSLDLWQGYTLPLTLRLAVVHIGFATASQVLINGVDIPRDTHQVERVALYALVLTQSLCQLECDFFGSPPL